MRKVVFGALLTFLACGATNQARADDIWCVRDFGSTQSMCVFPSVRDCVLTVRVRGGVCERQSTAERRNEAVAEKKSRKKKRVASRG